MNNIKDYREKELKNYVIGNILLVILLSGIIDEETLKNLKLDDLSSLAALFPFATLSAVVYLYVFLLDSLVPGENKQKIAYMGIGHLPGCTIFSDIKAGCIDRRLNVEKAKEKYKDIYVKMPEKKKERIIYENSSWYEVYSKYSNKPKIYYANKDYLLCRDITVMTIFLFIAYLLVIAFSDELKLDIKVLILFLVEFLLSNYAMRGKASRLVYNVIAEDLYNNDKKNE